jgi:transcriptional regulator with XRE-family HTH domain
MLMELTDYLNQKFFEWQLAQSQKNGGKRKTMGDFSKYIGIKQTTMSMWNSGQRPSTDNLRKLANKLGIEIYDVLGLPRPDEDLAYISQHWDQISEEFRRKFRKEVEKHLEHESKRIHKDRGTHANS